MMRAALTVGWLALAGILLGACNLLMDDLELKDADSGTADADTDTDSDTDTDVDTDTDTDSDTCDPLTDCDGECVDLTSNPEHCGACDHDCLGANCVASACDPIQLSDGMDTSTNAGNGFLSVGPDFVYWGYRSTPSGDFLYADKDGAATSCIVCDQGEPRETVTTSSWVFWVDTVMDELRRAPLDGSTFTTLWSGQVGSPIAVDATYVYWWDEGVGNVMQAEHDGSSPTQVATGQANVVSIAAEGGWLYWTNGNDLMELELSSPPAVTMVSGLTAARSLVADSTHVYLATGSWDVDEAIRRVPRGDTTLELLDGVGGAYVIDLDATHVYAANGPDGEIFRIPKDGGTPEVLATGQQYPFDIVVDDEAAYWSSEIDASLAKVAK